jgi:restriction system protein
LIDDAMFLSMLKRLPDERRAELLSLAVEGDYAVPTCPECGLKMIVRQHEQARYWGCRAFPRCKGVLAMRQRPAPAPAPA